MGRPKKETKEKKGRPDGLKRVSFTLEGKRYYCYGHTLKEARDRIPERKKELEAKRFKRSRDMTFDQYYERWSEAREGTVKGATLRKQESQFNTVSAISINGLGTKFGTLIMKDIETQHIRILQKKLLSDTKYTEAGDEIEVKRTPQTVNDTIAFVSHIFHDAVNERVLDWNPCNGIKNLQRTAKPARETIHRALTKEETRIFFKAAEGSAYYQLYLFLINSGVRIGEAGAITLSDIGKDSIQIRRTVTKTLEGYVIGDTTKTPSGKRKIPLTPDIRSAIENQKAINAAIFGNDIIDMEDTIFKTAFGNILIAANVDRDIANICRKTGLEKFTTHALRDTFATRALESGMNPKTLQEILGHSDFSMTMNLYAHTMEETKQKEMKNVKVI